MKHLETRLIHTRRDRLGWVTVNPPVERASTVLFDTEDALYGPKPTYGRMGLTVHRELEAAMCELEGATYARLAANGLQACTLAIASCVRGTTCSSRIPRMARPPAFASVACQLWALKQTAMIRASAPASPT